MCQAAAMDNFADFDIIFCQISKTELPKCQSWFWFLWHYAVNNLILEFLIGFL
jgi:hypothetical protein